MISQTFASCLNAWATAFFLARNDGETEATSRYALRLAVNGKRSVCPGLPW